MANMNFDELMKMISKMDKKNLKKKWLKHNKF